MSPPESRGPARSAVRSRGGQGNPKGSASSRLAAARIPAPVRAVMAWWRKKVVSPARRAWAAVSTRVRARNTGGGGGSGSILKLHEDVQTCGYRDVQVMFDILTSELEATAQRPAAKHHHQRKRPPSPSSPWPRYPSSSMIAAAQ